MCYSHRSRVSPPRVRRRGNAQAELVGDADRERATDMLADAHAVGYLTHEELDKRLTAALTVRTLGELQALAADLPAHWLRDRAKREVAAKRRTKARATLPSRLGSYLRLMAILVAIWAFFGVTAEAWYPWPLWPAVFLGFGVVGHIRAAYAPVPAVQASLR